ncbi:hypothetical protein C1H46_013667 [Malus baccata]|uniref:Uncharacterized protein n=1 Tax=Malus baccata TaxID=106549 RepID=A0A540MPK4_MALBA|nr:hypothetical protein C1H46_013667 [Malus baccata]
MPSLSAFSIIPAMVRNDVQSNVFVKTDEWVEVYRSHICFLRGVVMGVVSTVVIVSVHGGRFGKDRRLKGWSRVADELEAHGATVLL